MLFMLQRHRLQVNDHEVLLDAYTEKGDTPRQAVLIFPGGGYRILCDEREGEPVALAYLNKGINAFVLHYHTGAEFQYPSHLIEASAAMVYLKRNAADFGIDPDRIFAVGFSAGGHLAGCLAILHNNARVLAALNIAEGENKPAGAILAYPVISALTEAHLGSFEHLTGKPFSEISPEEKKALSLEQHVKKATSAPLFIWHTAPDTTVPVVGSLRLTEAYWREGIPISLRIYPFGGHGIGLATEATAMGLARRIQPLAQPWLDESVAWIKSI